MRPEYAPQLCHHGPGRRRLVNSSARFFTESPDIELMVTRRPLDQVRFIYYILIILSEACMRYLQVCLSPLLHKR